MITNARMNEYGFIIIVHVVRIKEIYKRRDNVEKELNFFLLSRDRNDIL